MAHKINGIDVSECAYFNSVTYEEPYCNIDQERLYACSGDENCYFKQLKRLQQENEKLKASANEAKIELENLLINRNDFAERAEKLEQKNKELKEKIKSEKYIKENALQEATKYSMKCGEFRHALEEIRSYCEEQNLKADYTACEVLSIIDKVLNEN